MTLTPPANFWPTTTSIVINGITSAVPPLYITGNAISIVEAADTHSGTVSTSAQSFAGSKNFLDGIDINNTQLIDEFVTAIAVPTDTQVPTALAVKDYVESRAVVTATSPLHILTGNVTIDNASATQAGVLTTGTQTIAGAKTFNDNVTLGGSLNFTGTVNIIRTPPATTLYMLEDSGAAIYLQPSGDAVMQTATVGSPLIRLKTGASGNDALTVSTTTSTSNVDLRVTSGTIGTSSGTGACVITGTAGVTSNLYAGGDLIFDKPIILGVPVIRNSTDNQAIQIGGTYSGSRLTISTGGAGGHATVAIGTVTGAQFRVTDATSTVFLSTDINTTTIHQPLMIDSSGAQLKLGTTVSSPTITAIGHDVTINSGIGTLTLSSTPTVTVSAMTGSSSTTTGSLVVGGGLGVAENIWAATLSAIDDTHPQVHLTNDDAQLVDFTCDKHAKLTIEHQGDASAHTLSFNGVPAHTFTAANAAINSTVTVNSVPNTNAIYITNTYGNMRLMIDDVGDTYFDTSRDLYINGIQMPVIVSQTVYHVMGGAATGASCTIIYQHIGTQVFAHLANLSTPSAGAGAIILNVGSPIPAFFRPTADNSNQMLVINGATNANGRYVVHTTGAMEFYTDPNTTGFAGSGNVGWYEVTLNWYKP
jgi:hypothetical protein